MKCPECGCEESKVIDSRPTENKVRRRRECIQCGFRFTTYEIIEDIPLMVIKKDNSIEPFDRQKLVDRLCRAAVKRPVKLETIENMVDEIAAELKNSLQREVTSEKIGEMVLHKLKAIDVVAYIRFASVYKDFNDVSNGYWAAAYIKAAAKRGWINGYGDGSFRADDEINRAEVVTIVNRLLGREADESYIADNLRKLNTFSDMSGKHWAYYAVMEAANAHTAILGDNETWSK